jgi:hypothetical protein
MLNPVRNNTALDGGVFGVLWCVFFHHWCVLCVLQPYTSNNIFNINTSPTPAQHLPNTFPTPSQHLPQHLPNTCPTPSQHLPQHLPNTCPTPSQHLPQHLPNTFPIPFQHLHVLTLFAASSPPRFACPMRPNNGCHVCCRCVRFHCTRCPPQVLRFGHQPTNLLCSKSTSRDHGSSLG